MPLQNYAKPGLMGDSLTPEQMARVAAARQGKANRRQELSSSQYAGKVPDSALRTQQQAYNQSKAQGNTGTFDDFMGQYVDRFGGTAPTGPIGFGAPQFKAQSFPSQGGPEQLMGGSKSPYPPGTGGIKPPPLDPHAAPNEVKTPTGAIRPPPLDPHPLDQPTAPPGTPTAPPVPGDPGSINYNDSGQNDQRTRDYNSAGFNYDTGQLPGFSEGIDYNSTNDMFNAFLSAVTSRDDFDTGGNSLTEGGQWNAPDWLQGTDTELTEDRLNALMRGDSEYLNIAADRANEQAAERGMLGSSVAAGNAVRAMREAALPIAQADADAINRGRLQSQGLMSNLYDSASDRRWRSREANTERATQLIRDDLGYRRSALDREDRQSFDYMNREDAQAFDAWQNDLTRGFQSQLDNERQSWEGNQNELNRQQNRRMAYFETMFGREGMLSNVLNGIYMNPNLTPEQARQAAENARGLFTGLWEATNRTFAQGIPEIFDDPYQMEQPPEEEEPANP